MLLGNEQINSAPGASTNQAGYFTLATHIFTPIGVSGAGLAVEQGTEGDETVLFFDTSKLPATPIH